MTLSPEFRRYLWIELTVHRLVGMPAILGALFYLFWLLDKTGQGGWVAWMAVAAYVAIVLVWGTRLAAESVTSEVAGGTWDAQRLSSTSPWSMTWGKLVGSTVYAWYGGLICLTVMTVVKLPGSDARAVGLLVSLLLMCGLLAHGVGLLVSLLALRKGAQTKGRAAAHYLLGLLAAVPFALLALGPYNPVDLAFFNGPDRIDRTLAWYGFAVHGTTFLAASLATFTAWAVLGAHRLLRAELQARNLPWIWVAFVLFLMAWTAGFGNLTWRVESLLTVEAVMPEPAFRLFIALLLGILVVYVMVITEPKDRVAFRLLRASLDRGDWGRFLCVLPRWSVTALLVISVAIAISVLPSPLPHELPGLWTPDARVLTLVLFMLRDVGLVLLLNLGPNPRRADVAAVLYLAVLYLLLPWLLSAAGIGLMDPFLVPDPTRALAAGLPPVLVQVVAVYAAAWVRWKRLERA